MKANKAKQTKTKTLNAQVNLFLTNIAKDKGSEFFELAHN